jgi:cob(I)alamin adenosyltransferase
LMTSVMRGYVQVYTGNGKGKTTAAIGLSVRAAGAGLKVFIAQFIKQGDYSEIKTLKKLSDMITVEQYGMGRFVDGKPTAEDIDIAGEGLIRAKQVMLSGKYDVIILEEANVAVKYGLIPVQELIDVIAAKPESVEIVITGRNASPLILDIADLVTEMKPVKHYYNKGVGARLGIEK